MENQKITSEEYQNLCKRLDEITKKLSEKEKSIEWIDNADFLQVLKISRRTGQHYRDSNLIGYTIIGNRIWYKLDDVKNLLDRHYRKRLV